MNYYFNFRVVYNNINLLLKSLGLGLTLAVISLAIAIVLGLVIAFAAVSHVKLLKSFAKWYVTILRNTPFLVLLYITYFGLPTVGLMMGKKETFIFTMSLYGAAYMTEVFRAGLENIPKGLIEAGKALGSSGLSIRMKIQLPIMFRNVLPSMGNYLISLFKDTALGASITIPELTYNSRILSTTSFRIFEVWFTTAALYVVTCYTIAFLLRQVESKLAIK